MEIRGLESTRTSPRVSSSCSAAEVAYADRSAEHATYIVDAVQRIALHTQREVGVTHGAKLRPVDPRLKTVRQAHLRILVSKIT